MSANTPTDVAQQYATDEHLQTRIRTHRRYSVGPELEPRIDALLGLRGSESLLDVGTGPGNFPGRLRSGGHTGDLTGVDLSAGMVERARAAHPGVPFVVAPAADLPFPDAIFDVLTARHMLYHVPSVPDALREFRRVLKPGGRFLAVTNTAGYLSELWDAVAEATRAEPALQPLLDSHASFAFNFSEENGATYVQDAFGKAEVSFLDSAFVFPDPAPVVAYLASTTEWQKMTSEEQASAERALRDVLAPRFQAGPWRVPKRVAFLAAVKE